MKKFFKYSWKNKYGTSDGFAIVQELSKSEMDSFLAENKYTQLTEITTIGKLIYGSTCLYEKSGRIFVFNNVDRIEELDPDFVANEHFVGLL